MVSRSRPLVPPLVVSGLQLALLAGCGALPEPIRSPTSCSRDGVLVQVEQGAPDDCAVYGAVFAKYRAAFEERWGVVYLEGWAIRFRTTPIQGVGFSGWTSWSANTVDVRYDAGAGLPHELEHVRLGPDSREHSGWCAEFVPWELSAVLWDDTGYLQCARCGSARAGSRLADHCRGPARLDEARHGLTRRDQARRRGAWQGGARPGKARQGKAHCFSTRSPAIRWTRCDWLYERGPTCASGRVRRVSSHTLFFLANCQKGHPEVALR